MQFLDQGNRRPEKEKCTIEAWILGGAICMRYVTCWIRKEWSDSLPKRQGTLPEGVDNIPWSPWFQILPNFLFHYGVLTYSP